MFSWLIRSLAFFALLAVAHPFLACAVAVRMEPSEVLAADAVFIGELTGYARIEHERFKRDDGRPIYTHAVLTYRVDETLRSELPDRVDVLWYNSTFGIPEESPFPQRQIVGLSMNQNEAEATAYHLLQKPCAPPA